ncbi:hypothetical protein CC2G_002500 [Coprinopsis cinerea AmutBmut pab1-1]|nr:hypothetical protein CC2G_002500 [Coprinopsis cinerea AmutBmut pab1-1]
MSYSHHTYPQPRPNASNLPVELIGEVFRHYIQNISDERSLPSDDPELPPDDTRTIDRLTTLPTGQIDSPLLLSQVCRSWRYTAVTTSSLWTSLSVKNPTPIDVKTVETWLARSKNRPLDITLEHSILSTAPTWTPPRNHTSAQEDGYVDPAFCHFDYEDNSDDEDRRALHDEIETSFRSIFNMVMAQSHRIRTLTIKITSGKRDLGLDWTGKEFPILTEFDVSELWWDRESRFSLQSALCQSRALTKAAMGGSLESPIYPRLGGIQSHWTRLIELKISMTSTYELLELLTLCRSLRRLEVTWGVGCIDTELLDRKWVSNGDGDDRRQRCIAPLLESLSVKFASPPDRLPFQLFWYLSAPNLSSLSVSRAIWDTPPHAKTLQEQEEDVAAFSHPFCETLEYSISNVWVYATA